MTQLELLNEQSIWKYQPETSHHESIDLTFYFYEDNLMHPIESRCHEIHGNKYTYFRATFTNTSGKVCYICEEHPGLPVIQSFSSHYYSETGCPKCANSSPHSKTSDEYEQLIKKHLGENVKKIVWENEYANNPKSDRNLRSHQKVHFIDKYGRRSRTFIPVDISKQKRRDQLVGWATRVCPVPLSRFQPGSRL